VSWINLRLCSDTGLSQVRSELLPEPLSRFFGLPYINDSKAIRPVPGRMDEQSFDWPI
jgi:hypothetical protein